MDKISFGKAIDEILESIEDPIVFTNEKEDTMSWDSAGHRVSIKNADGGEYWNPLAGNFVLDDWRLANIVSYTEAVQSGKDIMWYDSPMDVDDRFLDFMEPIEFLFQISAFYSEKEVVEILKYHGFTFQGGM